MQLNHINSSSHHTLSEGLDDLVSEDAAPRKVDILKKIETKYQFSQSMENAYHLKNSKV